MVHCPLSHGVDAGLFNIFPRPTTTRATANTLKILNGFIESPLPLKGG
jgi:hypothetical protein